VVIESQLDPGMGPTATVIVKRGTLKQGDSFVAGAVAGRARALMDHEGTRLTSAGPSAPVLVMGWSDVPTAGDILEVVKSDRDARSIAAEREQAIKNSEQGTLSGRDRLQGLLEQLRSEDTELRIILKADAHGSLEALKESIVKITREDGRIDVIHGAVGGINENDVTLAEVTSAIVVGFNVRPDPKARRSAERAGIEIRTYGIIYELLDELEAMLVGRLSPDKEEVVLGSAEVRALFKVPRAGTIAGSYITEGVVQRGARARLLRAGVVIHDGRIDSLRRFKDDVREVASGFECGIGLENYNDVKEGDVIEVYEIREVART
jgi:translation initiation factor IF-2